MLPCSPDRWKENVALTYTILIQVAAPQTTEELKSELARLRNERIAKRDSRLGITTPAVAVGAESKVLAELNKGKKDESNERMV